MPPGCYLLVFSGVDCLFPVVIDATIRLNGVVPSQHEVFEHNQVGWHD